MKEIWEQVRPQLWQTINTPLNQDWGALALLFVFLGGYVWLMWMTYEVRSEGLRWFRTTWDDDDAAND